MNAIKKKDLEIRLEEIPSHPNPTPDLEQYSTPADLAADILFTALLNGHLKGKDVVDLGCGTGIFTLGAAYLGASRVKGFDIDEGSVELAEEKAHEWGVDDKVYFEVKDIDRVDSKCDTVIMNPPFGSQKRGADIPFLKKSFEISEQVYTIHNIKTLDFLRGYIKEDDHDIFLERGYKFTVKRMFDFHEKDKEDIGVVIFGIKV